MFVMEYLHFQCLLQKIVLFCILKKACFARFGDCVLLNKLNIVHSLLPICHVEPVETARAASHVRILNLQNVYV